MVSGKYYYNNVKNYNTISHCCNSTYLPRTIYLSSHDYLIIILLLRECLFIISRLEINFKFATSVPTLFSKPSPRRTPRGNCGYMKYNKRSSYSRQLRFSPAAFFTGEKDYVSHWTWFDFKSQIRNDQSNACTLF